MDQKTHEAIMKDILLEINKTADDYILKGGTALLFCYNLDRFSTDIDIDSKRNLDKFIENYCKKHNYTFFIKKDTELVHRYSIHYDDKNNDEFLKIEISHRKFDSKLDQKVKINGINTYDINTLFSLKLSAGLNRSQIRDLYDICFIYNNYKDKLNDSNKIILDSFLNEKGGEYFDYLMKTQGEDEVINKDTFQENYLNMLYDLSDSEKVD